MTTGGAEKIHRRWHLKRKVAWVEQQLIRQVIQRTSSREEARQLLGLSHQGLHNKLVRYHLIALGHKESIRFSRFERHYEELDAAEKLYRKVS